MFKFLAGAIFALGITTSYVNASEMSQIASATVKLYDENTRGFCSGTIISENKILTANHCTDESGTNVRFQVKNDKLEVISEIVVYLKPVRTLKGYDVALLEPLDPAIDFTKLGVTPADIATKEDVLTVLFGDEVYAVGYPKALDLTATLGLFSESVKTPAADMWDTVMYRFSSQIAPGSSGGGLYMKDSDGQYKLIGVTVGAYNGSEFMNLASPYEAIEAVTKGFVEAKYKDIVSTSPSIPSMKTDDK